MAEGGGTDEPTGDEPPPPGPGEWALAIDRPLDEYAPGDLLALFDRRPAGGLDELGGTILTHLMVLARLMLEKVVPGDRNKVRRKDTEGRVLDHVLDRDGPVSFRSHFLNAVRREVGKHDQDLGRADAKPDKALHGSVVEPWLGEVDLGPDAYEQAHLRIKLREMMARIDDDVARRAVAMHLLNYTFAEIGEILGFSEDAARDRVRAHLPTPPPVERRWPVIRRRQLDQKKGKR